MACFAESNPHNPRLQEPDYLRWQYCSAPAHSEANPTIWLHLTQGQISGWIAYVPVHVQVDGTHHLGCYLQNWFSQSRDGNGLMLYLKATARFAVHLMIGSSATADQVYAAWHLPRQTAMPRWVAFPQPQAARQLFGLAGEEDFAAGEQCPRLGARPS